MSAVNSLDNIKKDKLEPATKNQGKKAYSNQDTRASNANQGNQPSDSRSWKEPRSIKCTHCLRFWWPCLYFLSSSHSSWIPGGSGPIFANQEKKGGKDNSAIMNVFFLFWFITFLLKLFISSRYSYSSEYGKSYVPARIMTFIGFFSFPYKFLIKKGSDFFPVVQVIRFKMLYRTLKHVFFLNSKFWKYNHDLDLIWILILIHFL